MEPTWQMYRAWLGDLWVRAPDTSAPKPESWQHDSRKLAKDEWFFPLKGQRLDGQDYIASALELGAAGFICDVNYFDKLAASAKLRALVVKDINAALVAIAKGWRQSLVGLKVVALTGSVGKTTTKEMVAAILRQKASTFATEGNFNNHFGVPLSLLKIQPHDKFAVIEIGARKPGDIAELMPVVDPDLVMLLNAKTAHLEIFSTPENLLKTKLEIVTSSRADAMVVIPQDDPRIVGEVRELGRKFLSFSEIAQGDVSLLGFRWKEDLAMEIDLSILGAKHTFTFQESHASYPINWGLATAAAIGLGIDVGSIQKASAVFTGAKRRYATHKIARNLLLIDDCYNANPDSMRAGLLTLKNQYPSTKKTIVLGQMLELGEGSDQAHELVGKFCYDTLMPELLLTVGERGTLIALGAKQAGMSEDQIRHFADVDALLATFRLPDSGLIYTKGSNGVNLEKFVRYILDNHN